MPNHGDPLYVKKIVLKDNGVIETEDGTDIVTVSSSSVPTLAAAITIQMSDGDSINDTNSNELIKFGVTASAVNEVSVTNAATGNAPVLSATGGDTNIAVLLKGKGTGAVQLGQSTSVGVTLVADQPILDSSANELVKFVKTASAVNELTVTNNSTGLGPVLSATGETNVPMTLAGKGTGPVNLGQATTTGVVLLADQPINDSSGNELLKFAKVASAVNELTVSNNSTGLGPTLTASGETNVPVTLAGKGTGYVGLGQATSTDVRLVADQPVADSSGNEYLKFSKTASAVNEVTITNAATNTGPKLSATGGDSNIPLMLEAKGTESVITNAPFIAGTGAVLSVSTAGDTTLTAAQVLAGIVVVDPNGAGRNLTFPTATALIAVVPGCVIGQTFRLHVVNGADAAETITLVADASGGFDANQTAASRVIPQNTSKDVLVRITNVGAPAYVIYA